MDKKITLGNDEFILHIRKKTNSHTYTNEILGKMIWIWLKKRGASKSPAKPQPCYWNNSDKVAEYMLPEHATQFEFDRALLPELYSFLDELAINNQNSSI